MKEFNYRRAHAEWALPGFSTLPQSIKDLYADVVFHYAEVHQNRKTLGLPWLEGFEDRFDAMDPETLARAANVIYGCGHWDYPKNGAGPWPRDNHGGYWKFEILAKLSLSKRGFTEYKRYGLSEGAFMDHKEGTGLDNDELGGIFMALTLPEFETVRVTTVNHRPDMFCIGPKHFTDFGLDVKAAPCAVCGEAHDRHTSDKALIVRRLTCTETNLSMAEEVKLRLLKPEMEFHKIDGIAFVR